MWGKGSLRWSPGFVLDTLFWNILLEYSFECFYSSVLRISNHLTLVVKVRRRGCTSSESPASMRYYVGMVDLDVRNISFWQEGGCTPLQTTPCRRYQLGRVDCNRVRIRPISPRCSLYRHFGVRRNGRGERSVAPGSVRISLIQFEKTTRRQEVVAPPP